MHLKPYHIVSYITSCFTQFFKLHSTCVYHVCVCMYVYVCVCAGIYHVAGTSICKHSHVMGTSCSVGTKKQVPIRITHYNEYRIFF